jgi:hypothetical protein
MNYSKKKETIWHFICDFCNGWWSIAEGVDWKPGSLKNFYCPHCGKERSDDIEYTGYLHDE